MKKFILMIIALTAIIITTKEPSTKIGEASWSSKSGDKITKLDVKINDSTSIVLPISVELVAPFEDFLMYARNNKIELNRLQDLEFIYYSKFSSNENLDENLLGVTFLIKEKKDQMYINSDKTQIWFPTFIEGLIYHEMMHLFLESPSHCIGDRCPHIARDGRDIDPEFFVKTWDGKRKNYYFKFLSYQINQKKEKEKKKVVKANFVTATVYNAVASQCNKDFLHTAFMFKLDSVDQYKHRIIAVSRDLLKEYPKGTEVRVEGTSYDGIYTVMDKMGKSSKYRGPITNSIDILINTDMPIGKWNKAKITKIN